MLRAATATRTFCQVDTKRARRSICRTMVRLSHRTTLHGALLATLTLAAGCGGGDSAPSGPYLGTLDPIIYVGQTASPSQLVSSIDGRPLPSSLTVRID